MKKACPHCNTTRDFADELQGTDVQCILCRGTFAVPILLMPIAPATGMPGRGNPAAWMIGAAAAGALVILWILSAMLGGSPPKGPAAQSPAVASSGRSESSAPNRPPSPSPNQTPVSRPPTAQRSPGDAADSPGSREATAKRRPRRGSEAPKEPAVPSGSPTQPFAPSDRSVWKEGFEDGLGSFWSLVYLHPEQPHGKGYATSEHFHSGHGAFALEQAPGQHSTSLEHVFPEGFQGRLSVWMLLLDRDLPPGAARDIREGSHTCVKAQETDDLEFQIGHGMKSGQVSVASRCIQRRKFDRTINAPLIPGGWHQYTVEVRSAGTRGYVDGAPLSSHHPSLTVCHKLRLEIGWSCGGIVVWDDFEAVP
jgi:hypothetical protein